MARHKFTLSVTACVLLLVPVVVPTLFVLRIGPVVDQVGAQELGPKQGYLSGPRPAEAPPSAAKQAAMNQSAKPAGKMNFIPASPAPRNSAPKARPTVANPVVRREVPQPSKYAVAAGTVPEAPRLPNLDARSVASRPAKPQPSSVASKTPLRAPVAEQIDLPQQPAESEEPVVAATEKPPVRMLEEPTIDEPIFEEPLPEKGPVRGVVQLFFEDEARDEDSNEMMDVDESPAPIPQRDEIRHVAAEGDTTKAQNADYAGKSEKARQQRMAVILEDLKPVRQIELRKAVILPPVEVSDPTKKKPQKILEPNEFTELAMKLPDLSEEENKNIREPNDVAFAIMNHRKPFNVFGIARDPWQANRDSYPFCHKPLWFEDPNLERCGRGCGPFTSTVSMIRASANIPILPYRFTAEKPWSCVRTLPDCTTCEKFGVRAYLPPWSLSAAAVQAAATVGIVYIIP